MKKFHPCFFVRKNMAFIAIFLTFAFICNRNVAFAQVNYTWNGVTSTAFTTSTNWTPNGVPTAIDNVTIVTGSNNCIISANTTVNNLTLTSGTLNIGTFTLTINGNATFTLGTVNGTGTLNCAGATTVFGTTASGPTINPNVVVNSLSIRSQRTTFNRSVNMTKTIGSTAVDSWRGGNTFNSTFTLTNAADDVTGNNGDIYFGSNNGDPTDFFQGRTTFILTGAARIRIPQSGSAVFNGVTTFLSAGFGANHDRIQPSRLTGASCVFNDSVYMTINSNTSDMHVCYDAGTSCIFNGPVVCNRLSGSNGGAFNLGIDGTVTFNHNLIINNNSTGQIDVTTGTGTSSLANGRTISVGAAGFNSGTFFIENFTQNGTTNQSLTFASAAALFIGAAGSPCVFNANTVNFTAGRVRIQESTFAGTSQTFNKTGATADDCGGNTFNGAVVISNSSGSEFRFSSVIGADVFASTVDITNSGTGSVRPSRSFNTSYPQNITVNNTSTATGGGIFFGANGGTSTLAATKTISVGAGGYQNGYLYLYRFNQIGGTAQNIDLSGVSTTLRMGDQANITSGCNFGGNFIGSAKGIELTGNTFSGTTVFNQSGTATTRTWGGNTFTGAHTINVTNAAGIQASQLFAAETYLSTVTVNLSGTGGVTLSRSFNTNYPENILLTSTSTGSVGFGLNGGTSTLANTKTIAIGGLGYTGNFLYLYRFTQLGATPQTLTLTGSVSQIELGSSGNITYGSTFNGNLTVSAANFLIASSTFNGNCNFTKTGASGTDDNNNGNNTFNGSLTFANNCATAAVFVRMSNIFGDDTYNGVTTITSSCSTGGFVMARTFNGNFNENVICNSTNGGYIYFGAGNALAGIATLAAGKTITCGTFNSTGLLSFRRFQQLSNTPQTLTTTGTASIDFGATIASTVTNSFTTWEGDVIVNTGGYTAINNSTFQRNFTSTARNYLNFVNSSYNVTAGNTSMSRVAGTSNDDLGGNNVVNGNFSFSNTGSGRFRTGVTAYGGDTFNGNVTINNSGTATLSFSYNNGTNTIAGNLDLLSSSTGSIIYGEAATSNATTIAGFVNASSGNYTNGTINLRYLTQNGGTNNITGTSSAVALTLNASTYNGIVNISTTGTTTLTASTFNAAVNTTNAGTTTVTTSIFNDNVTMVNTNTTSLRTSTYNAVNTITSTAFILGGTLAQGNTFNNGTSTFNKTGTSNDDVNGGNVFNALTTFNTSNASGRWRLGVNAADDFNANVVFNQNAAGVLAPAYDANSTFAGDITVSAPAGVAITFGSGTGRVTMDEGNAQTINKTTGDDPNFSRLTINKTANDVTLNTRINVITDFAPTVGILNTTVVNILNMNNSATTTIGNNSSYVNGPMNYAMASNSATRRTLNFPIGKVADWRPSVLQVAHSTNTSYTYRAEVFNASAEALGWTKPATVDTVSYVHYWDIDRYTTSTMVNTPATDLRTTAADRPIVTLYFGSNDGVRDGAYLTICKNTNGAPTTWIDIGGTGAPAYSGGAYLSGSITSTSSPTVFNSFSRFTLGSLLLGWNPLPIELLSFTATPNGNKVDLKWTTASERNNDYFTIEKTKDGQSFEFVAMIDGAGNSNSILNYTSVDYYPYQGTSYYRLKQTDFNGKHSYSNLVAVDFKNNAGIGINVYPNPNSGNDIHLQLMGMANEEVLICITDVAGKLLYSTMVNISSNEMNHSLILENKLAAGIYFISATSNTSAWSKKMIVK